jgi:hypothetical protein
MAATGAIDRMKACQKSRNNLKPQKNFVRGGTVRQTCRMAPPLPQQILPPRPSFQATRIAQAVAHAFANCGLTIIIKTLA